MRYIPTSAATAEALKKQAKKLQRKSGGKHAELLDRIARGAGYDHWHHVTLCLRETEAKEGVDALNAECDLIVRAAREGKDRIVITGPETLTVPLVLFASQGDAWLIDADEGMATCLIWRGEAQVRDFEGAANDIEIAWDGRFAIDGDDFAVDTSHPLIGKRRISGYPLFELRQAIDKAQSFDKRFSTLMLQDDAVELTPELSDRLVAQGWERKAIEDGQRDGARYSPSRNSLLYPQVFGGFETDDDEGPTSTRP
jgi:hypothetical protein